MLRLSLLLCCFFVFLNCFVFFFFFFFFQAEDGIRDGTVTGLQTCALPILIALSANYVLIAGPDGAARPLHVPAENVGWGGPTHGRTVETLDTGFENVIVEIKHADAPAKPVTHPPTDDPRALIEPDHHWLLENQYVRVYDVRVPAGRTTQFHKHGYDTLFVEMTDEIAAEQSQGGEWQKAVKYPKGEVAFSADWQ